MKGAEIWYEDVLRRRLELAVLSLGEWLEFRITDLRLWGQNPNFWTGKAGGRGPAPMLPKCGRSWQSRARRPREDKAEASVPGRREHGLIL